MVLTGKGIQLKPPGRKRARTEDEASSTCSSSSSSSSSSLAVSNENDRSHPIQTSASDILRVERLCNKLSALLKEFPEMKFIIEFENLKASVETAVVKYVKDKEAEKHNADILLHYGQDSVLLFSLPDEVLSKCLSFVGRGHYGSIGVVSKKLRKAYKEKFGRKTAYIEMATSIKLANHCLNELCKNLEEKDEMLKAAAVNGNLDILRHAVSNGYDLFPLVAMKKTTLYTGDSCDEDEDDDDYDCDMRGESFDMYYTNDNRRQYPWEPKVNLAKLVERGHLHVLKYLHEELNYFVGLQRYCFSAIQHGQLEILKWLEDIDIMGTNTLTYGYMDDDGINIEGYCASAIKSGHVEVLDWLGDMGYEIEDDFDVLAEAIRTKSIDMIQYCFDLGFNNLTEHGVQNAIKETKCVKVFRLMYELGYEFGEMKKWYGAYKMEEYFEIIKFLRSISIPWDEGIMNDIVAYGTLEMIQYAHRNGCAWTGEESNKIFGWTHRWSMDKFKYLIDNGCTFDYEQPTELIIGLRRMKERVLLEHFVGKSSSFDNQLFKEIFEYSYDGTWFEGMSYLLEKGKNVQNFKSIEEVLDRRNNVEGIKYFHGLGLPWCLDSSRNTILLSKIACNNDMDDIKWAYENGCKGGDLVSYVKEEWEKFGIRHRNQWKSNQAFFEENGLLDETFLEKSGIKKLDPQNVHEIGDAELGSLYDVSREISFFDVDFCTLKNLVDHGYMFRSESEKEAVCKEAYKKCCEYSKNEDKYRKRLALFVGMGARDL